MGCLDYGDPANRDISSDSDDGTYGFAAAFLSRLDWTLTLFSIWPPPSSTQTLIVVSRWACTAVDTLPFHRRSLAAPDHSLPLTDLPFLLSLWCSSATCACMWLDVGVTSVRPQLMTSTRQALPPPLPTPRASPPTRGTRQTGPWPTPMAPKARPTRRLPPRRHRPSRREAARALLPRLARSSPAIAILFWHLCTAGCPPSLPTPTRPCRLLSSAVGCRHCVRVRAG